MPVPADLRTITIIERGDTKASILESCDERCRESKKATSDHDRDKLREQLAKLAGGVAVIHVVSVVSR
jgi:chaperonin GroEL